MQHRSLVKQKPIAHDILAQIGATPLLDLSAFAHAQGVAPGVEIFAKAEWFNPGGSVKARAALQLVVEAEAAGLLCQRGIVVNDTLRCWGLNDFGQLGDGTTTDRILPNPVGTATWKAVDAGDSHACAIRSDDTLWCWGFNGNGQLGDGSTNARLSPVQVGTASWKAVDAGGNHTCAIRSDDTLWCWGYGLSGQLGVGSTVDKLTPTKVGTATWKSVSTGADRTCGVRAAGPLWCWGKNADGQLGRGSTTPSTSPVQIGTLTTWKSVVAGPNQSYGLLS